MIIARLPEIKKELAFETLMCCQRLLMVDERRWMKQESEGCERHMRTEKTRDTRRERKRDAHKHLQSSSLVAFMIQVNMYVTVIL